MIYKGRETDTFPNEGISCHSFTKPLENIEQMCYNLATLKLKGAVTMTEEERKRRINHIVDMLIVLGYDQIILDGTDIKSLIETIEHSIKNSLSPCDF